MQKNEAHYLQKLYESRGITFPDEVKLCVILPEAGCSGCIASGTYHILTHKDMYAPDQSNNLLVFTAITSKKILMRNLDIQSRNELNCIFDEDNDYLPDNNNKIYPIILRLSKGVITDVSIQSPESDKDYFAELEKSMANKTL